METKSFGSNVLFSCHDTEKLAESWAPIVRKAVAKVLADPDWATEVLDGLIQDYTSGKFTLNPNRNIDGYIYRAASNRAKLTDDECDRLEQFIEDLGEEPWSTTELNDAMWFDFESICEWLGLDYEEVMARE